MTNAYDPIDMLRAIHRSELEEVKAMIAGGADLNAQSHQWSPAMQACGDGQIKALRVLIAAGADLNASGEDGMTPLIVAAMEGEEACLAALLKAGVDLEKRDDKGCPAGAFAAASGSSACLARLLKAGADMGWRDEVYVDPSCVDVLDAERARREKVELGKVARKAGPSAKAVRM